MKNLRLYILPCFAVLLFLCLNSENAWADLINPTIIDNKPLVFEATVDMTLLTADAIVLGGPDFGGEGGNWSAVIMQVALAADGDGVNNDILFELFHDIAPHPELGETAPKLVFSSEGGAGFIFHNVVPGTFLPGLFGATPHGLVDQDTFSLTYLPLVQGVSSRLTVKMNHAPQTVPEPCTFTLLGIGSLGLLGHVWRWRKRA